jgi:hypothetical protein
MTARKPKKAPFETGAAGGDGASLRLYASSNQDMISLNVQPVGTGLIGDDDLFRSLGIIWFNDLKTHLSGTEKGNHRG